ncbi:MAG: hypothetical protein Q4A76_04035 [Porphyromonadaceae bacterium]|nr:hypothetical protein [Porphyromonadaceae bacterium]
MKKILFSMIGLFLVVGIVSCKKNTNPKLDISINKLTDPTLCISYVGDSVTYNDTLKIEGTKFQKTLYPDTALYKQVLVSFNKNQGFVFYVLDKEGVWVKKKNIADSKATKSLWENTLDNVFFLSNIDKEEHAFADSTQARLLVCFPNQKADSTILNKLKADTTGLFICVLTPVDSIAEKTGKAFKIPKGRTYSDWSGQITDEIITPFHINRLPALVSIDSVRRVKRTYI